uniref:Uncharacterized protein n=1 Tax=Anopheles minimus TaxID=112268 RepID=A0A182WMI3_9DIPT
MLVRNKCKNVLQIGDFYKCDECNIETGK